MSGSLGIDFGTAHVAVALLDAYGNADLVPDRQEPGRRMTAASVHVGEDGCLAGEAAEELADADPRLNIARKPRALFGQRDAALTDAAGRPWSPEGLAALLLRKVVRDAQDQAGELPAAIALAAPPWFNDLQRRALRDAAKVAGLAAVQIVDEPLAAAAFHRQAIGTPCRATLLVNLGYSGATLSVLRATPQGDAIAGTIREPSLGLQGLMGEAETLLRAQFAAQTGTALPEDPATVKDLSRMAKALVESLASGPANTLRRVLPIAGRTVEAVLFPHQWSALFARRQAMLGDAVQRCLEVAGVGMDELRLLVLYGAGAAIPAFVEPLKKSAAQDGLEVVDAQPTHAVACGAALLAQTAGGGTGANGTLRTCAHDLGVTVFDRKSNAFLVEPLIARGTALPASARKTVYTNRADQKRIVIQVAQVGGSDGAAVDLGVFEFGPIAAPRKNYPVEITLSYDADGIVAVSALDPETGARMEQVLGAEGGEHANWILRQRTWAAELQVNE